jgi:hypothetical protein
MTQVDQTEASCLLQSGALYHSRVGLMPEGRPADLIFLGFKKGAFSIYHGDAPIYHFDLEGRWQRAFLEPTHLLKGLDTRVHAINRVREGPNLVLRRRILTMEEVLDLDRRVRGMALGLIADLDAGRLARHEPPPDKAQPLESDLLRDFLTRITSWDEPAWNAHRARYLATYGPLPFLPPDSQNAVVLQATLGDAGAISFGRRPVTEHAIRSPAEFQAHVQAVAELLGRRVLQSRLAFLAGSDVLRLPRETVNQYLETVGRAFQIEPRTRGVPSAAAESTLRLEGIHAFLDDFGDPRPERAALRAYRQRHLVHVSLGVESGDSEVRRSLGKTWSDNDLRAVVADLRAAEIGLSLLTIVGAGGMALRDRHRSATARLLTNLDLRRGDTAFLLDERELADLDAAPEAEEELTGDAWIEQLEQFKLILTPLRERGVKVLPYSLEKQWA